MHGSCGITGSVKRLCLQSCHFESCLLFGLVCIHCNQGAFKRFRGVFYYYMFLHGVTTLFPHDEVYRFLDIPGRFFIIETR